MKSKHTRTGVRRIWCWCRIHAHQRTLVLNGIQLELVTPHPQCHLIDTRADTSSWSYNATDGWQELYICVSSVYRCEQSWYLLTSCNKSAVYSMNRLGPRTNHSRTPDKRKVMVEEVVPRQTYCMWPSRYDWNQLSTWLCKTCDSSSCRSNVTWLTMSYAANKSSSVNTARSWVSSARRMLAST